VSAVVGASRVVNLRASIAAATASVALGALAASGRADGGSTHGNEFVVTLATDGSFLQVGRPVPVKITLENRGTTPVDLDNAALFGCGITVRPADGDATTGLRVPPVFPVPHQFILPAGASCTAKVELAQALPAAFAKPGRYVVVDEIAGVKSAPLELELARDWTGFHAALETEFGEIELEFFPDVAPRTVSNFLSLVDRHFYDGLTFHRVVKGFMVQGGDPKGDGTGNSGKFVPFEKTGIKHERGVISMARQADFNSASCQFFLVHQTAPFLDGNYAAFGRIVRGLEVLDRIAEVPCAVNPNGVDRGPSKPKDAVRIAKLRLVPPAGK
jgi:peptidyl-prolyl cis-trans isomerase B (cyclophilin B)